MFLSLLLHKLSLIIHLMDQSLPLTDRTLAHRIGVNVDIFTFILFQNVLVSLVIEFN